MKKEINHEHSIIIRTLDFLVVTEFMKTRNQQYPSGKEVLEFNIRMLPRVLKYFHKHNIKIYSVGINQDDNVGNCYCYFPFQKLVKKPIINASPVWQSRKGEK